MRYRLLIIITLLALALTGCGGLGLPQRADAPPASVEPEVFLPAATPTAMAAMPSPLPATPTPDLTLSPLPPTSAPTQTGTPVPSPTRTSTPGPTDAPTPAPLTLTEPAIVAEIALRDLPGTGRSPSGLAWLDGRLYVTNMATANVSIVHEGRVSAVVPVGANPVGLSADAASGQLYVANQGDDSLSVLAGDRLARTLPGGKWPAAALSVEGQLVLARADGFVQVVDPRTGERVRDILLDASSEVLAMAADPVEHLLFLSAYNETHVVDTRTWKAAYKVAFNSYVTLAASPHTGRFYVNDYDGAANQQYLLAVRAVDGSPIDRAPIGGDPRGAAVNAATGRVYVANSWTNDVSVIQEEPFRLLATVPVGMRPVAVAVDEAANRIYVANADSDSVSVIDGETNRVVATIPLAMRPADIALDPANGRAYVANPSTNSVFVIQGDALVAEYPAGSHPAALALDPRTHRLYVANQGDGTGTVLDAASGENLATVRVGDRPEGAAVNPATNRVYFGETIVDAETLAVVGRIGLRATALGAEIVPRRIVVDADGNRLYAVAFNGTPGSNGGDIIYVLDATDHRVLDARAGVVGVTALALDAAGGRLYASSSRMGYTQVQAVDLASGQPALAPLELWKYPRSLAFNPATGHLFLGLTPGSRRDVDFAPEIAVLDGDLRPLLSIPFPGSPAAMALDPSSGRLYVADAQRGRVFVVQDVR